MLNKVFQKVTMCAVKLGDILNWLLLVVSLQFSLVSPVKINELRVPAVARHGTAVILDCDYTFDGPTDHEGLVVKWYLNDQSRPVYVWIPGGSSGPKGLGVLSGRLNLGYRVSEDAKTEHRALHIEASARDLAGEYTCVVSTFQNEDRKTKFMLVFVPEKSLRLNRRRTDEGMEAVCIAEGVYPDPEMTIRVTYQNITREFEGGAELHRQRDGLYDVSLAAPLPFPKEEDIVQSQVDVSCELTIPAANYTVHKDMLYYPGKASQSVKYTWVVLTAYGIVKYLLNF